MIKNLKIFTLSFAALAFLGACDSNKESGSSSATEGGDFTLRTEADSISYVIGRNTALNLQSQPFDVNAEGLRQGIADAFAGIDSTVITVEEGDELIKKLQQRLQAEAMQKQMEAANSGAGKENEEAGKAFLEENKSKEGVQVTESGLQYKVIEEGSGESPTASDRVKVHYEGQLIDGTVFDSSYERGEPATFPVNGVIPGWVEGLQLMKEGAKYQLFIPSDLAYGLRGAGGDIGPNATLIFDVELIEIVE